MVVSILKEISKILGLLLDFIKNHFSADNLGLCANSIIRIG